MYHTQQRRRWDLVVNCNTSPYKRLYLASQVANRVHISYAIDPANQSCKEPELQSGFCINRKADGSVRYMSPNEVVAVLHCCKVGGIFSAEEGACYASTEYLLCGLPVVSTASIGGRHVWYSTKNSIIVKATASAVAEGVKQALQKLEAGEFNRDQIRQDAIQLAEKFRAEFVHKLVSISKHNLLI